jgi:quercetin dioxygenase-like cupin family protein
MNPAPKLQTIIRKPLLTANLDSVKTTKRIEIKRIDFAPGQATGLHDHPCPVVGYIASGSVKFQVQGQPPQILRRGDAFFEPPNQTILHFDNASDSEPLSFIAFYLLDENEHELIRMLESAQS